MWEDEKKRSTGLGLGLKCRGLVRFGLRLVGGCKSLTSYCASIGQNEPQMTAPCVAAASRSACKWSAILIV
jgi:uncharacterized membrane protein YedE/YeeE